MSTPTYYYLGHEGDLGYLIVGTHDRAIADQQMHTILTEDLGEYDRDEFWPEDVRERWMDPDHEAVLDDDGNGDYAPIPYASADRPDAVPALEYRY